MLFLWPHSLSIVFELETLVQSHSTLDDAVIVGPASLSMPSFVGRGMSRQGPPIRPARLSLFLWPGSLFLRKNIEEIG